MRKAIALVGSSIIALVVALPGAGAATNAATPTPAPTAPAIVNPSPTIAILDTALNVPLYPNIVHEVCSVYSGTCPNGKNFMDGAGAANVPDFYWGAKNISHGSMVVGAAMLANPKVKIVFIRISDVMTYQGNPIMGTQLSNIDAGLTSIATPIAATLWSTRFSGTWDQQYAQMKKLPTFQDQYKNTYYWIK